MNPLQAAFTLIAPLSVAVCSGILIAGWQRRCGWRARAAGMDPAAPRVPRFELSRTPFASGELDVTAELDAVMVQLGPEAARRYVQLEMAVQPELAVRADPRALREVMGDLVANAIRHCPCGRVLVGAERHGGRVQISVTDDGVGPTSEVQEGVLRTAAELVALQGGTFDVQSRPGAGTTVTVRLPEMVRADRADGVTPGGDIAAKAQADAPAQKATAERVTNPWVH